jgi:hypothetical protein
MNPKTTIMLISLKQLITAACIFSLIIFTSCNPVQNIEKPEGTLSRKEANLLEETYIKARWNNINAAEGYTDTREFVFELDRLKQYIAYVENEALKKGYSDLGIRIYLAAYPEGFNQNDRTLTTVFLAPTAKNGPNTESNNTIKRQQKNTNDDDNIDSIDALNFSHGGMPPKNYD